MRSSHVSTSLTRNAPCGRTRRTAILDGFGERELRGFLANGTIDPQSIDSPQFFPDPPLT
jgi:hypothetical protein